MLIRRVSVLFLICIAALIGTLIGLPSNVPAQEAAGPLPSGTGVIVWLEASVNQPEPDLGPPTDMLVFTGGPTFLVDLDCFDEPEYRQNAVLVDVNGRRSSRAVSVIAQHAHVEGEAVPVTPGTRVTNFIPAGGCNSGGITYRKYVGTVE
jgi:hypothetical protein